VKQKSLQRPPTIRFTDSVLRTGFLIIILRFGGGGGGCGGSGGDFNISPNSRICPSFLTNYPKNMYPFSGTFKIMGHIQTFFNLS